MFLSLFPSSAIALFPFRRDGTGEIEHRLLRKAGAPEAAPEGAKKEKEKPKEGGDTVKKETEKIKDAVKKIAPEAQAPAPSETAVSAPAISAKPSLAETWKPLPRPPLRAIRNTVLTGAALAAPVLAVPAAAGWFAWKKLSNVPPFRWVNNGVKRAASVAANAGSSALETATYLPRLGAALSMNTLRAGKHVVGRSLDATVGELYRDLRAAINHKFAFPEGTNLLAAIMMGVKRMLLLPKDVVKWYADMWKAHPKLTLLGSIAIPWITLHGGWPAVIKWGGDVSVGILKIIQGIAGKIGTVPPVVPPIP